ncbi:helix-turn-helix domain-containing protein [Chryseobacterium rhizosphaerae]|uniref:helix-turn-helix domain-containing protein n=1 Tax=Chryseobacterium rhizosphaerae TaxID=395937 RepID=UPI003D09B52A
MNKKEMPDYKKIYTDMIEMKYPEKKESCREILESDKLLALDIIALNKIIFGKSIQEKKHRSYDKTSILRMLDHQEQNNMTNVAMSRSIGISRNSIAKWKKMYLKNIDRKDDKGLYNS